MAGSPLVLYRNYSESDATYDDSRMVGVDVLPTIEDIGWEPPSGKRFKEWNSERDGSGNYSFQPGDEQWLHSVLCAIWEEIPVITYLTTDEELTSVADAIRTKGGTSSPLVYPTGFVSAINAIPTGVDLSNDTVESSVLLEGYTAHDKNGTSITGSLAIATMSEVETYFGLT